MHLALAALIVLILVVSAVLPWLLWVRTPKPPDSPPGTEQGAGSSQQSAGSSQQQQDPGDPACDCSAPPDYTLTPCPDSALACMNVANKCMFPVWVTATTTATVLNEAGNPWGQVTVRFDEEIAPQSSFQFSANDSISAGRIYIYYRDPREFDPQRQGLPGGTYPAGQPIVGGDPSQEYCQLAEFTGVNSADGWFWDYDLSMVDRAALPVYMYAKGANQQLSGGNCNKTYNACPPDQIIANCPTAVINEHNGAGQCLGSYVYCMGEGANSDYCHMLDGWGSTLGLTSNPTASIYGCSPLADEAAPEGEPGLTPGICMAINRGICQDPGDPSRCPIAGMADDPDAWYAQGLPQNNYSRYVRSLGKRYYGFSLDEGSGGGNQQCRYANQLDIVVCPSCG